MYIIHISLENCYNNKYIQSIPIYICKRRNKINNNHDHYKMNCMMYLHIYIFKIYILTLNYFINHFNILRLIFNIKITID
jgi:hypothetical protein